MNNTVKIGDKVKVKRGVSSASIKFDSQIVIVSKIYPNYVEFEEDTLNCGLWFNHSVYKDEFELIVCYEIY